MAPARRYLVLAIFVAACLTQANCKPEPTASSDDTLYFRGSHGSEIDPKTEINAEQEEEKIKAAYIGPIGVKEPIDSALHVPWWSSFTLGLINRFKFKHQFQDRSQFSFLYMGKTSMPNQNAFPLNLHPSDQDGTPVMNSQNPLSPSSRDDYVNYVAARHQNVQNTMVDAQREILDEMNSLWNSYKNHYGHPPNTIVLYSWIMPCPQCTDMIIKYFNQVPFSTVPFKVVAYTNEGTNLDLAYMTPEGNKNSRHNMNENKITYWNQQCEVPDSENSGADEVITNSESNICKASDTFQGCFVGCLGRDFCCSCKESRKTSMNVAMVNDLAKDCATSNLKICARSWVQNAFSEHRSGASPCTDLDSARAKLLSCVDTCVGRPLSKPLNPLDPSFFPGYLETFSDIIKYAPVTFTDFCSDIRAEGYLCYNLRADSFTAGNSPCREKSVCAYEGEKYKWCYTDHSGHWDYCCTSACSYGDSNYLWCQSGNTWQYCGNPGEITVKHRHCMHDYPCGMHQDVSKTGYYWCYTDTNKNWGYCCQPGDTCSKKRENYDWCWVGYKKKTTWQYCNTEAISKPAFN